MIRSPGSLRRRLFLAFVVITLIAILLPWLTAGNTLYNDRLELAGKQALTQAALAGSIIDAEPNAEQLDRLFAAAGNLSFRMTLTDASGRVIRDSHFGAEALPNLDNHGDRPEIEKALEQGTGISLRYGNSLGMDAVYAAVALKNGGVLRIAVPLADIQRSLKSELFTLGFILAGAAVLCLILSAVITERIRNALNEMAEVVAAVSGDRHKRLREVPAQECIPLAHAVNQMAAGIEEYVRTVEEQQSRIATVLDSIHEGVLVLGPGGEVRSWNKAFALLFPRIAESTDKSLIDALPVPALQRRVDALLPIAPQADEHAVGRRREAEDAAEERPVIGDMRMALAENVPNAEEDALHFELPAGRFLVAHIARPSTPNRDLGAIIVIYNATELMRLETVRRDFAANVSHELRTPLTAIAGYAETLMTWDGADEECRRFAGIIHKHASALAATINNLLELARIENTAQALPLTTVNAATVLENTLARFTEYAAKEITVTTALEATRVRADAPLLGQVFRNLLENACRYSPLGGEVRIASTKQGDDVLFTVTDNGPGIPKEALPRIFERFYQVKKERNSGTAGIGLAVCKHIIERHGGRIWAESPYEGAATAVLFTLPQA